MTEQRIVKAQPPTVDPGPVRLAIIGEAPGLEEQHWTLCAQGHGFARRHWDHGVLAERTACPVCGNATLTSTPLPFVGPSGRLLNDLLTEAGLPRARCFVGNCSRLPPSKDELDPDNPTVASGLAVLSGALEDFKPNCLLLLGNLALRCFHPTGVSASITDYRGSVFNATERRGTYKCVAALHPASVLREPSQLALLRFDIQRAVREAASPTLELPERFVWRAEPGNLVKEQAR